MKYTVTFVACLGLFACGSSDPSDLLVATPATDAAQEATPDAAAEHALSCPADMTLIGKVCIDTEQVSHDAYYDWQAKGATLVLGCDVADLKPDGTLGVHPCGALAWCQVHGRRLCTQEEWMPACTARIGPATPWGGDGPEWLRDGPLTSGQHLAGGWWDTQPYACPTAYISSGARARIRCCSDPK